MNIKASAVSLPVWLPGLLAAALLQISTLVAAQSTTTAQTLLLRQPSVSRDHIAFVYAGDIWLTDRNGQNPQRLTAHAADEFAPVFSPDGKWIAFSARYDNNVDVYVMPVEGGQPKRLTWHPSADTVNGWSPDGKRVLFASSREIGLGRSNQLYEVSVEGGAEKKVMEAQAFEGAWSKDGSKLAYRPYRAAYSGTSGWRLHRGGSTPPVWVINPTAGTLDKIPHVNASDTNPFWVGDDVVFVSDRSSNGPEGAANLFLYNSKSREVRQLTKEMLWDVRSASAYEKIVVFEVGGRLKELDMRNGAIRDLPINISAQAVQARTQWKDAAANITSARLSPTGKRVIVSARGDIFTVPVKDGSIRNLTLTSGIREKDGLWSHDGKRVAYISDAGMRHVLVLRDQAGLEKSQSYPLGKSGYFTLLAWSPDGKTIAYQDNHLNLYSNRARQGDGHADRQPQTPRRFLGDVFAGQPLAGLHRGRRESVQPDSHPRCHQRQKRHGHRRSQPCGQSGFRRRRLSLLHRLHQFRAAQVGLDMSSQERPVRDGIYALVLAANGKSPMAPRSGDENDKSSNDKSERGDDSGKEGDAAKPDATKPDAAKSDAAKSDDKKDTAKAGPAKPPKPVRIDFDGLQQRVVALPLAERNYDALTVASDGSLFYLERSQPGASVEPPEVESTGNGELYRFSFEDRKARALKRNIANISISADGKKLLLQYARGKLEITDAGDKFDAKPIDLTQLGMVVNPQEEWAQVFDETWWMEKEFFYDVGLHGIDWDAVRARYRPLLKHVQRREDLNDVLAEMIGELQVGHNRVGGGDLHKERPAATGLLGADFSVENEHYRIKSILAGDRWNPFLKAPLAVPGLGVKEGDYILAVNGRPVNAKQNLYSMLEGTIGKQVTLSVGFDAAGKGAHNIVVQPIGNEQPLRQWNWVERNRQYVDKASGGKVAYVYLPDTGGDGYKQFNRMFFAQVDKQAVIVDDRRNGGGQAANYITDVLSRQYLAGWKDRDGLLFETPGGAIYGPKAMLIDQDAGSGGDFLPYSFKRLGLGPLIGKRTWGGLIGIAVNPSLIDGGNLVVPYFRFFTPEREWRVENEGVAPDIDVELDPVEVNKGRDTQLDAAIKSVMDRLQSEKQLIRKQPPAMPTQLGK